MSRSDTNCVYTSTEERENNDVVFVVFLPNDIDGRLVTWSRNDRQISTDRFASYNTRNRSSFAIRQLEFDDAGKYSAEIEDTYGSTKLASVDLDIRPRTPLVPNYVKRLHDISTKIGSRARFLIEIDSSTPVKVTWYHDNQIVKKTDRFNILEQNNYYCLDVAWTTLQDEGHWTCIVENKHGCSVSTAYLSVIVPKAYKAPQFVEELRAILGEDETVSLECKVVGVPTPILQWYKDGKKIKAGDTFALKSNANDLSTLGTYSCVAKNCLGQAFSSSTVHFHRENDDSNDKCTLPLGPTPKFVRELRNVEVQIETPLTLSCQVGVPPWPKTIDWYNKSGKIIDTDQKYKTIADGLGMYAIEIKSVEMMDNGEWKCVATNFFGIKAFSSCYVTVKFPKNYKSPKFLENLRAVMTPEGLVSFECKVIGYPTPQLKWLKDGRELKPGDVYQLTGTNSLGTYCCIAKNPMGELKSTTMLTLEDIQTQLTDEERLMIFSTNQPPYYIKGLMSQEAKINEEFQFNVQVNAKPEPNILWYRNDELIEQNERISIRKENERCYSLHVKNLHLLDQAEWKCVAVNDFGQSVTSCFLKLIIPKHYKAPKFLEELRANFTQEGTVNLDCKVIGVPQPELRWYKDGKRLKAGQMHKIISGTAGTCCLGTYTCEAINCMATGYSSASLRALTNDTKPSNQKQTNPYLDSLSVIIEEQTSQLNNTSDKSTTYEEAAGVLFSFDGKEVSISLYETPDLTEEEALQIVEMYANELTEQITEQNVVELPSLRFIKETTISGNIMMEATIVDVPGNDFNVEDELKTDAGIENSMMDDSAFVTNNSTYSDDDISADKITFNSDFSHNILQTSQSCIDDLPSDETKIKASKILTSIAANSLNDVDKGKPINDQILLQKRKSFGSEDDSLHEFERLKATKVKDSENTIPEVTSSSRGAVLERIGRAVDCIEQNLSVFVNNSAHPNPSLIVDPIRQLLTQIDVTLSIKLSELADYDNILNLIRQPIASLCALVDTIGENCDTNDNPHLIAINESIKNAIREPLNEIENELQSTDDAKSLVNFATILDKYSKKITDLEQRLQTLPTISDNHQNLVKIVKQTSNVKDWSATLYENYAEQNAIPDWIEFEDILSQYLDTNINIVGEILRQNSSTICDKFITETKPAREALTHTLQIIQFLSPSTGVNYLSNSLKCVTSVGQHFSYAMAANCDDDSFIVDANCVKWADDSIEIILNSLTTIAKCTNADIPYHKKRLLLRFDSFRDSFSALQRQLHSIEHELPANDHQINGIQAYKIVSELSEPLQNLRCQLANFVDDYKIYCKDDSLEAIVQPILPTLGDLQRRISNFHEIVFDQDVDCIDLDCILYALNNLNPSLCELANGMMHIEEIVLAETPIINDPKLGIRVVIKTVSNLVDAVVALRALGDSDSRCSILLKLHDPLVEIRNSLNTINNRFYEEELDRINITMLKTLSTPFNNLQRTLLEIADYSVPSVPVVDLKRPIGDLQRTILTIQDQVSFEYGDEPASIEYNIITLQTLIEPMNVLKRCCIDAANTNCATLANSSQQSQKRDDILGEIERLLNDLKANKALTSVLTSSSIWRSISAIMKSYQTLINSTSNSDTVGKCVRTIRSQFNRIEHTPDAMLSDVIIELGNLVDAIESPTSSNLANIQSVILDKLHSNLLTIKNANFQDDDCMKCSIALLQSIDTIRTLKENMGHYSSNASTSDSAQSSMLISFVNTCERLEIRISNLLYILESQSTDLLSDEFYQTAIRSFHTLNSQLIHLNKCLVEQSMSEDEQKEIPFQSSIECFNKLLNCVNCATKNDDSWLKQIASHIKDGIIDEIDRFKSDILFNMALIQTEDEVTINESEVFEENLIGSHADLFDVCLKSMRDEFRKCDKNIAQILQTTEKLKPLHDTNTNIENLSNIIRFVDKNIPSETNPQKICISQLYKPTVRILQKIRQIETRLISGEQALPVELMNTLNDLYEKLKLAALDVIRVARTDEGRTNEYFDEALSPSVSADFVTIRDKWDSIDSDEFSSCSSDDKPSLMESSSFSSDILGENNAAEIRTRNMSHIPKCEFELNNEELCDTVDTCLNNKIAHELSLSQLPEFESITEGNCDLVLPTVQLLEHSSRHEVTMLDAASEPQNTIDTIENVRQIAPDGKDLTSLVEEEFQTGVNVLQDFELKTANDDNIIQTSLTVNGVQIKEVEQTVQTLEFPEQCLTNTAQKLTSVTELGDAIHTVENICQDILESENLTPQAKEKSPTNVKILEKNELECADIVTPIIVDDKYQHIQSTLDCVSADTDEVEMLTNDDEQNTLQLAAANELSDIAKTIENVSQTNFVPQIIDNDLEVLPCESSDQYFANKEKMLPDIVQTIENVCQVILKKDIVSQIHEESTIKVEDTNVTPVVMDEEYQQTLSTQNDLPIENTEHVLELNAEDTSKGSLDNINQDEFVMHKDETNIENTILLQAEDESGICDDESLNKLENVENRRSKKMTSLETNENKSQNACSVIQSSEIDTPTHNFDKNSKEIQKEEGENAQLRTNVLDKENDEIISPPTPIQNDETIEPLAFSIAELTNMTNMNLDSRKKLLLQSEPIDENKEFYTSADSTIIGLENLEDYNADSRKMLVSKLDDKTKTKTKQDREDVSKSISNQDSSICDADLTEEYWDTQCFEYASECSKCCTHTYTLQKSVESISEQESFESACDDLDQSNNDNILENGTKLCNLISTDNFSTHDQKPNVDGITTQVESYENELLQKCSPDINHNTGNDIQNKEIALNEDYKCTELDKGQRVTESQSGVCYMAQENKNTTLLECTNIAVQETKTITDNETLPNVTIFENERDLNTTSSTKNFDDLKSENQEILPESNIEEATTIENLSSVEEATCYQQKNEELDNVDINIIKTVIDDIEGRIKTSTTLNQENEIETAEETSKLQIYLQETVNSDEAENSSAQIPAENVALKDGIRVDDNIENEIDETTLPSEGSLSGPDISKSSEEEHVISNMSEVNEQDAFVDNSTGQITESKNELNDCVMIDNQPTSSQEGEIQQLESLTSSTETLQESIQEDIALKLIGVNTVNISVDSSTNQLLELKNEFDISNENCTETAVVSNKKTLLEDITPQIEEEVQPLESSSYSTETTEINFVQENVTSKLTKMDEIDINTPTIQSEKLEIESCNVSEISNEIQTVSTENIPQKRDNYQCLADTLELSVQTGATIEAEGDRADIHSEELAIPHEIREKNTILENEETIIVLHTNDSNSTLLETGAERANQNSNEERKLSLSNISTELADQQTTEKSVTNDIHSLESLFEKSVENCVLKSEELDMLDDRSKVYLTSEFPHSLDNGTPCAYNDDNTITSVEINTVETYVDTLEEGVMDNCREMHSLQEFPYGSTDTVTQTFTDLVEPIIKICTHMMDETNIVDDSENTHSLEELPYLSKIPEQCFENNNMVGPVEVETTDTRIKILEETSIHDENSDLSLENFGKDFKEAIGEEIIIQTNSPNLNEVTEELFLQNNEALITPFITVGIPNEPPSSETFTLSQVNVQHNAFDGYVNTEMKDDTQSKTSSNEEDTGNEIPILVKPKDTCLANVSNSIAKTNENAYHSSETVHDSIVEGKFSHTSLMEDFQNDINLNLAPDAECNNQVLSHSKDSLNSDLINTEDLDKSNDLQELEEDQWKFDNSHQEEKSQTLKEDIQTSTKDKSRLEQANEPILSTTHSNSQEENTNMTMIETNKELNICDESTRTDKNVANEIIEEVSEGIEDFQTKDTLIDAMNVDLQRIDLQPLEQHEEETVTLEDSNNQTILGKQEEVKKDKLELKVIFSQENTIKSSNIDETVLMKEDQNLQYTVAQLSNTLSLSDFAEINVNYPLQRSTKIENDVMSKILNGTLQESFPESYLLHNEVQTELENIIWEDSENYGISLEKELANAEETQCSLVYNVIEGINCPEVKFLEELPKEIITENDMLKNEVEQQLENLQWEYINNLPINVGNELAIAVQTSSESSTLDVIQEVYLAEVKIMDEKQPTEMVRKSREEMSAVNEHSDSEKFVSSTNNGAVAEKSDIFEQENHKERKLKKLSLETKTAEEKVEEVIAESALVFDVDNIQKYSTKSKVVEDNDRNVTYNYSIQEVIEPLDNVECKSQKKKLKNSTDDDNIEVKQSSIPVTNEDQVRKKESLLPEIKTAQELAEETKMENTEIFKSDDKLEKCKIELLEYTQNDERNLICQNSIQKVIKPIDNNYSEDKMQENKLKSLKNDKLEQIDTRLEDADNDGQNEDKFLLDDQENLALVTKTKRLTANEPKMEINSMGERNRIDSANEKPNQNFDYSLLDEKLNKSTREKISSNGKINETWTKIDDDKVVQFERQGRKEEKSDVNVATKITKNETDVKKTPSRSTDNRDINTTKSGHKSFALSKHYFEPVENGPKTERTSEMKHFKNDTAKETHREDMLSSRLNTNAYARRLETGGLQESVRLQPILTNNRDKLWKTIKTNHSGIGIDHIRDNITSTAKNDMNYPIPHIHFEEFLIDATSDIVYSKRYLTSNKNNYSTSNTNENPYLSPNYGFIRHRSVSPTQIRDRTPSPTLSLYSDSVSNSYDRNYEYKRSSRWREFEDTRLYEYGQSDSKLDYNHKSNFFRDTRHPRLEFGSFSYWNSNRYHKNRILHYRSLIREAEDILTKFAWHEPYFNRHHFIDFPLFRKTLYDIPHAEYQTNHYSTGCSATPRFKYLCAEDKVPLGNTVTLHVEVEGTPKPNIEWLREGKTLLPAASRYHYIEDSDLHTLVISDFSYNDGGNYKCMAWNTYGMANTTTSIHAVTNTAYQRGKPPMFITRPSTIMSVNSGSDVSISFRLSGDPKPKVFWMKGLTDITENNRTCKETINDYTRLILNRAQISDAGTYFIIAKNKYGTDRAFFTLRVNQWSRSLTPIPTTTTYKCKSTNYSSYSNGYIHKQSSFYYHSEFDLLKFLPKTSERRTFTRLKLIHSRSNFLYC